MGLCGKFLGYKQMLFWEIANTLPFVVFRSCKLHLFQSVRKLGDALSWSDIKLLLKLIVCLSL